MPSVLTRNPLTSTSPAVSDHSHEALRIGKLANPAWQDGHGQIVYRCSCGKIAILPEHGTTFVNDPSDIFREDAPSWVYALVK